MVKLHDSPPQRTPEGEKSTHCVRVEFTIEGSREDGIAVQDMLGHALPGLLADVVLTVLGREKVPTTHIKVHAWRKKKFGIL